VVLNGNELMITLSFTPCVQSSIFIRNARYGYGSKIKGEYELFLVNDSTYKAKIVGDLTPSDKGALAKNQWFLGFKRQTFMFKPEITFQLEVVNA